MTTRFMNAFVLFFLALVAVVSALPIVKRDVFVPHITYPHNGTVWKAGHRHNVTWYVLTVFRDSPRVLTWPAGTPLTSLRKSRTLLA